MLEFHRNREKEFGFILAHLMEILFSVYVTIFPGEHEHSLTF